MKQNKIPDKITYRRKEVIALTKLSSQVLDFWEQEFNLNPAVVSGDGEKFYSRSDLEKILKIKELLVTKKMSRQEVKHILQEEAAARKEAEPADKSDKAYLKNILVEVQQILTLLSKSDNKNDKNGA